METESAIGLLNDSTSTDSSITAVNQTGVSRILCDLTQSYSFILQSVLGVLAFSTLILKRFREKQAERRPFWIWVADTTKQALGMLEVHFVNLILSHLIRDSECISYLVNFLLDSTVGLLLIYLLLKIVASIVSYFQITALKSGEYGEPFKLHYWLAQLVVYMSVMLVMKLMVGPMVAFTFWKKVDQLVLPRDEHLRIAIVIFIVPFVVNVIMFWIVDSILMRRSGSRNPGRPPCYSCRGYGRVYSEDREDEEEEEVSSESGLDGDRKLESYELQVMTRTYQSQTLVSVGVQTDSDR